LQADRIPDSETDEEESDEEEYVPKPKTGLFSRMADTLQDHPQASAPTAAATTTVTTTAATTGQAVAGATASSHKPAKVAVPEPNLDSPFGEPAAHGSDVEEGVI
jgi:hypothetical protein